MATAAGKPDFSTWPEIIAYFTQLLETTDQVRNQEIVLGDHWFDTITIAGHHHHSARSRAWYDAFAQNSLRYSGLQPRDDIRMVVGNMCNVMFLEVEKAIEAGHNTEENVELGQRLGGIMLECSQASWNNGVADLLARWSSQSGARAGPHSR